MVNILISGACGKMGVKVAETAAKFPEVKIVCGVDRFCGKADFPIYDDFTSVKEPVDVVIDFSSPQNLAGIFDKG